MYKNHIHHSRISIFSNAIILMEAQSKFTKVSCVLKAYFSKCWPSPGPGEVSNFSKVVLRAILGVLKAYISKCFTSSWTRKAGHITFTEWSWVPFWCTLKPYFEQKILKAYGYVLYFSKCFASGSTIKVEHDIFVK